MSVVREVKRRLRGAAAPVIFLLLTVYFVWNAVQGERGLEAFTQRQALLATASADRAKMAADLHGWERRVAELRANHLDPDMLDERARGMLNRTGANDIIVQYGPKDKLFQAP
jgi:cell division protein FtsB